MIGHIYRIIHLESDIQYVGSTFNEPRKRWQAHKSALVRWTKDNQGTVSIFPYFQEYGIDQSKLIPIKSYDVADRKCLLAMEQLWVSKLRCINKNNPFLSNIMNPTNKRSLNIKKQYYQTNKAALNAKQKIYNKANEDSIKARRRQKYQCECSCRYSYGCKTTHLNTKKHQRWLNAQ
ncbi:hypothetical protein PHYSODRAFT_529969 [Phytophthora sojae]|uniref:GIY-YIG domain-containing protein n=1 Tax=Phytophthora sojae (strain P6497) TaxID=1094619 RepID=G5ACS0_PHYSP|nr:hypothetical protein PHYSODRAFT_529969 [Phytophthora sojae]EGZ07144.1 hypothetical protein PHYSODRAFT_529969 [Phytophthora sojae]|eukprot:XP_009537908.1 hypothetical protein PHYSODRAFT_529969 [Phytophthora sojae]